MIYHDDHDYRDDLLLRGNRVSSFHSSLWRANGKVRMHSSIDRITEKLEVRKEITQENIEENKENRRRIGEKRSSKSFTLQSSNIR